VKVLFVVTVFQDVASSKCEGGNIILSSVNEEALLVVAFPSFIEQTHLLASDDDIIFPMRLTLLFSLSSITSFCS
jgi:hypothetical protein